VPDSVTITINEVPAPGLSPNARGHHMKRHRLVQAARDSAYYETRQAYVEDDGPIPDGPLSMHILIAWPSKRRMADDDNAIGSCKAYRDGIADALGVDDRQMHVASITQTVDPEKRGYIKIALEATA
jgi:hypothetical protein